MPVDVPFITFKSVSNIE